MNKLITLEIISDYTGTDILENGAEVYLNVTLTEKSKKQIDIDDCLADCAFIDVVLWGKDKNLIDFFIYSPNRGTTSKSFKIQNGQIVT